MMWRFGGKPRDTTPVSARPVLDLSGPKLRAAFEQLVDGAESAGGIESYVRALVFKASLFEEVFGKGRLNELNELEFRDLCAFITPVRRRIGVWLGRNEFSVMRARIDALLSGWSDVSTTDARLKTFIESFPVDRKHRWVRDLAAETLHFTAPERYPLMTRWMWDLGTGTGVLREMWYAQGGEVINLRVADDFATFSILRGELEGFLRQNGVFRDLPFYVDLLCAQVYAFYINDRGGQYLRADFCGAEDPLAHTRRLLGLDAVSAENGRTRLKLIDGAAYVLSDPPRLSS